MNFLKDFASSLIDTSNFEEALHEEPPSQPANHPSGHSADQMTSEESRFFYALCTQINGVIQVRKFSFDNGKTGWFDLLPDNWPIDQHPLIDKYIQKKKELNDNGHRTAKVPIIAGRSKHESPAAQKYIKEGKFVVNGVPLQPERAADESSDYLTEVQLRDTSLTSTVIFKRLGE